MDLYIFCFPIYLFLLDMLVCAWMCVCYVHTYMHVWCMYMYGLAHPCWLAWTEPQGWSWNVFYNFSILIFDAGSLLLNLKPGIWLNWLSSEPLRSAHFCPQQRDCRCTLPGFYMGAGDLNWDLHAVQRAFYPLGHLLSSGCLFLTF